MCSAHALEVGAGHVIEEKGRNRVRTAHRGVGADAARAPAYATTADPTRGRDDCHKAIRRVIRADPSARCCDTSSHRVKFARRLGQTRDDQRRRHLGPGNRFAVRRQQLRAQLSSLSACHSVHPSQTRRTSAGARAYSIETNGYSLLAAKRVFKQFPLFSQLPTVAARAAARWHVPERRAEPVAQTVSCPTLPPHRTARTSRQ